MADPIHQFEIKDLIPLHVGGLDLSFTNSAFWMVAAALISTGLLSVAMRQRALVPGRLQVFAESMYEFVGGMIRENIGTEGKRYFPFVFTLFMIVLMGNMLGMLPYAFTFTSHIIVTMTLALLVFFAVTIIGFMRHGLHFLDLFNPPGVPFALKLIIIPIEVLSFLIRPVTLSVRLFANMMAGHLVLKVFAGFCLSLPFIAALVPMGFNVLLIAFEFLIAFLQAYVFTILTCIYLKDAVELH